MSYILAETTFTNLKLILTNTQSLLFLPCFFCFGDPTGVFGGLQRIRPSKEFFLEPGGPDRLFALCLKFGSLNEENMMQSLLTLQFIGLLSLRVRNELIYACVQDYFQRKWNGYAVAACQRYL